MQDPLTIRKGRPLSWTAQKTFGNEMIGAGWLRDHPAILEWAFLGTRKMLLWLRPLVERLGFERSERWLSAPERVSKEALFDCKMCGQCVLHSTGMTCPMTCPKEIRNGPCGGVRPDGNCEVIADMKCIWVEAFERSLKMRHFRDEMRLLQPPVNRRLEGSSAWINMLTGVDVQGPTDW
jgi:hypothetical protein